MANTLPQSIELGIIREEELISDAQVRRAVVHAAVENAISTPDGV